MISLRPYTADDVAFADEHLYGEHAGPLQWFGFSAPRWQAELEVNGLLTESAGRLVVDEDGRPVGGVQWFRQSWGPPTTSCSTPSFATTCDARSPSPEPPQHR